MAIGDKNLIFTDLETTGTDPEKHEITEIAMLIVQPPLRLWASPPEPAEIKDRSDFSVIGSWETKVAPEHIETADPESLSIAGWNPEEWKGALGQSEAIKAYAEKARGGILVAYNVTFDWVFLETTARRCGVSLGMDYHRLDALSMAYLGLFRNTDLAGLGLEKVAKALDIPLDRTKRHSAMEDTKAMYEIFKKLIQETPPLR